MVNVETFKENASENVECFATEHPVATTVLMSLAGLVIGLPICVASYKFCGRTAGKAAAKELMKAGVQLGYTHH